MTTRIRLSLAAPGMDKLLLSQWSLSVVTVGCLFVSGCIWWFAQSLDQQSMELEQQTTELRTANQQLMMQASTQGIDLSDARLQNLAAEVAFARQIRKQLGFSWTQFLNDLESTVPTKVSMASVKVNFAEASIALSGSAQTLADLNRFVDGLENHPAFYHVVLSQHAEKRKKKGNGKSFILFSMTVEYSSKELASDHNQGETE